MAVQMPAGVLFASAQPARPQPTYAIAYVFNADPALPIFSEIAQAAATPPQAIEAQSDGRHHETPEPPVPAAQPPEEPAPTEEPPPAPQPQEGAQEGEQPVRQPLPRGEAERRALAYLAQHPDEVLTPGQLAKKIDARGVRDLMARLAERGLVELVQDKPLKYRAARSAGA